jgi:hypothetical protein
LLFLRANEGASPKSLLYVVQFIRQGVRASPRPWDDGPACRSAGTDGHSAGPGEAKAARRPGSEFGSCVGARCGQLRRWGRFADKGVNSGGDFQGRLEIFPANFTNLGVTTICASVSILLHVHLRNHPQLSNCRTSGSPPSRTRKQSSHAIPINWYYASRIELPQVEPIPGARSAVWIAVVNKQ